MGVTVLLFYLFAAIAVLGSLAVIGQRSPMYSVLALIVSFTGLSGLYIGLDAPFVAMIQIIIYAGAIMVLFLFVVMLLNAPTEEAAPLLTGRVRLGGAVLAGILALELIWAARASRETLAGTPLGGAEELSSVAAIGRVLFRDYAFAFEVTSVLILVAMVGAVVLARRERS